MAMARLRFFSRIFGALIILAAVLILHEAFGKHLIYCEFFGVLPFAVVAIGTLGLGAGCSRPGGG